MRFRKKVERFCCIKHKDCGILYAYLTRRRLKILSVKLFRETRGIHWRKCRKNLRLSLRTSFPMTTEMAWRRRKTRRRRRWRWWLPILFTRPDLTIYSLRLGQQNENLKKTGVFEKKTQQCLFIGVMVKSVFAKITGAKWFLCFLMIKNTPAERKSPWDNHKSFRSTTSTTTVAAAAASTNATKIAECVVVIPGTFPFA